jgi:signal transduction histidine kinase
MANKISQIESELETIADPKEKVIYINQAAESIRAMNIEESMKLSAESIKLAQKISHKEGLARAFWNSGICARLLSKYDEAFGYFEKALAIYEETGDLMGKAKVINSIGNIYLNLSDYKFSLEYLNKSLEILKSLDDKQFEASVFSNLGLTYQEMGDYTASLEHYLKSMQTYTANDIEVPESLLNNIGIVYQNLGDYVTSLDYFFKSLKLAEDKNNTLDRSFALGNIAIVYSQLKDYENALKYFNEGLQMLQDLGYKQAESNALSNIGKAYRGLENFDMALECQLKVLAIQDKIADFSGKAATLLAIGEIYVSLGNYETARQYYLEGLALSQKIGDSINETSAYLNLGVLSFKTKDSKGALENLFKALERAEARKAMKELGDIHKVIYEVYKFRGDLEKAFEHHEKYYAIEKEILNIESERKLKSLAIQFQLNSSEKERKIALQEKEIYRLRNVELADANDKLTKLNEEKNEFMGIAAHDLKNPLSGILSFSKKIQTNFDKYGKEKICEIAGEMEMASERMFGLIAKMLDINAIDSGSRNLEFREIDAVNVANEVVLGYKDRSEAKNIKISLDSEPVPKIYADLDAAKQILDNLISNALKFSPTGKKVSVSLCQSNNSVRFEVKDEGPGLSESDKSKLFGRFARLSAYPTGNESSTGLGLSIVKKLTELMGGSVWCESERGEGAKFIFELPVSPKT